MGTQIFEDREYQPWQGDGIQFLNGDWEIWRAENEGTYYYTMGGTPGRGAVDAMSLIDWHMAKLIEYEELTPWSSAIEFKEGDWEIMRDLFANGGANKYKKYYVMTPTSIKKVNMYGLLSLNMATANDATENEILRTASDTIRGEESSRPWPSDAIIFTPRTGVTISRASSEGFYIFSKGLIRKTVKADSLLSSGDASPLRAVGLAKLAFVQDMTRAQFEAEFGGFWMHDDPSSIGSLREVVSLWRDLCSEGSAAANAIVEKYRQVAIPIAKVSDATRECMKRVSDMYGEVKAFDADIDRIISLRDELTLNTVSEIGDELEAKFEEMFPKLIALRDEIVAQLKDGTDDISDACEEFKRIGVGAVCPARILPTHIKNKISSMLGGGSDISEYSSTLTQLNGSAPSFMRDIDNVISEDMGADRTSADSTKRKLEAAVQAAKTYFDESKIKLDELVDEVYKYIRGAHFRMRPLKARTELLDRYRPIIDRQAKKKLAKSRPRSTDNIRFVASIDIFPSPRDAKCYSVPLKDGRILALTVPELVYLGLAEYTM